MCSSPGRCAVVEITGRPSARTTSTMIGASGTRMPTVRRSDVCSIFGTSRVAVSTNVYGPGSTRRSSR